jgi:hypothetical protein
MRMLQVWPQIASDIQYGVLTCRGTVRPSPLCRDYDIRVEYQIGSSPKTWVESPTLVPRVADEPIPHVYTIGGLRPCLYFPKGGEWRADKWLALTIMPWLLLWLFFYEIWLATGEWWGEGVDHSGSK